MASIEKRSSRNGSNSYRITVSCDAHACTTYAEAETAAMASGVIWYCSHCGEGRIVLSCRGEHYDGQCFRSGLCSFCGYTQNYLGPCA